MEELWQLFPIVLVEHRECWAKWYRDEVTALEKVLPIGVTYFHVGSTAVPGIMAKPIVDILIVAESREQMVRIADLLQASGEYIVMSTSATRISLNKGYTDAGFAERVFHLHIRLAGDADEVLFRDYLIANPNIAREYEALKLKLWRKYEHDRDGYTNAKTEFVTKYTDIAKRRD